MKEGRGCLWWERGRGKYPEVTLPALGSMCRRGGRAGVQLGSRLGEEEKEGGDIHDHVADEGEDNAGG